MTNKPGRSDTNRPPRSKQITDHGILAGFAAAISGADDEFQAAMFYRITSRRLKVSPRPKDNRSGEPL